MEPVLINPSVKRDDNGIIICRSEKDRETMLYADGVRKLRQREYDHADLYNDTENARAEQKVRLQQNFIGYFEKVAYKRHSNSSKSILVNWQRSIDFLKLYAGDILLFSDLDISLAEDFRLFLLSAPRGGNKGGIISHNTASTYFSVFKAALKQAFIDGKMLGHTNVKTTQIYARVVDEKKNKAAQAIRLDLDKNVDL